MTALHSDRAPVGSTSSRCAIGHDASPRRKTLARVPKRPHGGRGGGHHPIDDDLPRRSGPRQPPAAASPACCSHASVRNSAQPNRAAPDRDLESPVPGRIGSGVQRRARAQQPATERPGRCSAGPAGDVLDLCILGVSRDQLTGRGHRQAVATIAVVGPQCRADHAHGDAGEDAESGGILPRVERVHVGSRSRRRLEQLQRLLLRRCRRRILWGAR